MAIRGLGVGNDLWLLGGCASFGKKQTEKNKKSQWAILHRLAKMKKGFAHLIFIEK
jgi:hypothetical protein